MTWNGKNYGKNGGRPRGAHGPYLAKLRKQIVDGEQASPLEVLISNMRFYYEKAIADAPPPMVEDENAQPNPFFWREKAEKSAIAAAPYVHPRLANVEAQVDVVGTVQHAYISDQPLTQQEWIELYGVKTLEHDPEPSS